MRFGQKYREIIIAVILLLAAGIVGIVVLIQGYTTQLAPQEGAWYCEELGIQLSYDRKYPCYVVIDGELITCVTDYDKGSSCVGVRSSEAGNERWPGSHKFFSGTCSKFDEQEMHVVDDDTGNTYVFKRFDESHTKGVVIREYDQVETWWNNVPAPLDDQYKSLKVVQEIEGIHTAQEAESIGQRILTEQHENGNGTVFVLGSIVHSKHDNVWRFVYYVGVGDLSPTDRLEREMLYIVMDGDDGSLIKAWIEEG